MWRGGKHIKRKRRQMGGSMTSCPAGTHMMPNGTCMQGAYHGAPSGGAGYQRGGRVRRQTGGHTHGNASYINQPHVHLKDGLLPGLTGQASYYDDQPGTLWNIPEDVGHHNHSTGNQVRRQRNQAGRLQTQQLRDDVGIDELRKGGLVGGKGRRYQRGGRVTRPIRNRRRYQKGGQCKGCR